MTVVEMTAGLLPGADRDLVDILARRIKRLMKAVLLNTRVDADDSREATASASRSKATASRTAQRTGVRPRAGVGRPAAERERFPASTGRASRSNERGFIVVDEQLRTAEPSIFAIGDVVGEPMLAHKASHEGRVAVEVIAGENVAFEPQAIPAVVFTDPEIAWAGLTEAQAQKDGRKVIVAKFPWGASGRAITLDRTDGLTKLILDPDTERILGVGLVGPGAGELIAEGVLAIEMGANATDLKLSIHPHPTLTETLMESAEVFFGQATHVYRPEALGVHGSARRSDQARWRVRLRRACQRAAASSTADRPRPPAARHHRGSISWSSPNSVTPAACVSAIPGISSNSARTRSGQFLHVHHSLLPPVSESSARHRQRCETGLQANA